MDIGKVVSFFVGATIGRSLWEGIKWVVRHRKENRDG